jgi:hypothetical protein
MGQNKRTAANAMRRLGCHMRDSRTVLRSVGVGLGLTEAAVLRIPPHTGARSHSGILQGSLLDNFDKYYSGLGNLSRREAKYIYNIYIARLAGRIRIKYIQIAKGGQ